MSKDLDLSEKKRKIRLEIEKLWRVLLQGVYISAINPHKKPT